MDFVVAAMFQTATRGHLMTRSLLAVACLFALILGIHSAHAQSRVFVAAQGSDSNPCSFAAPCRGFQHAHDIVAAGGEVIVLDDAGYGIVTITKSISITAPAGLYAGISVPASGTGVTVNGAGIAVTLRGITITGQGANNYGIQVLNGSARVESSIVTNVAQARCSSPTPSSTATAFMDSMSTPPAPSISCGSVSRTTPPSPPRRASSCKTARS